MFTTPRAAVRRALRTLSNHPLIRATRSSPYQNPYSNQSGLHQGRRVF